MEIVYAYNIDAQIYNTENNSELLSKTIFLSEKEALRINSMGSSFKELIFASIIGKRMKLDPKSPFYDCFYKYKNELWLLLELLSRTPYLTKCKSRMLSQEKRDEINKVVDSYDFIQVELCELQSRFTKNDKNHWSHLDVCDGVPFIKSGNSLFKLKEESEINYHESYHYKIDILD